MKRTIQYKEVQQFRQSWLWYLLISSSAISLLPLLIFTVTGEIPPNEGIAALGIVLLVTGINMAAFYFVKLEIEMSQEGIAYRWWPFFRRFSVINWSDVAYVQMKKYSAFKFGYHRNKQLGKVHNVDGTYGYQVVLHNGEKYYFGTQKRLSAESVLRETGKLRLE